MKLTKYIIGLLGFSCINATVLNAQGINNKIGKEIYTIDINIPSYVIPSNSFKQNSIKNKTINNRRNTSLEEILSLNNHTHLILLDTISDLSGGFHESYIEYYKGVEIDGTRCTLHYDKEGSVSSINGNLRSINYCEVTPSITENEAFQYALNEINAEKYAWEDSNSEYLIKYIKRDVNATYKPHGELVLLPKDSTLLAYRFVVETVKPMGRWQIYVDANNGKILAKYNKICTVNASVLTTFSGQQTINTQLYNGSYRLRDYTRGNGIETFDYDTQEDYYSPNNSWDNLSAYDRAALDAHWGVEKTYDFYSQKFNRNSYDNNGAKLISFVNKSFVNAAWTGNYMLFGKEGQTPWVDLDITAHELTHAVTESTSNLNYQGESGALNEGMSDIFGICVENEVKPNNGQSLWIIGENVRNGGIRNIINPTCKFYHGTGWIDTNSYWDQGGVHTNSGVFNYWFYLLVNGGSGTNEAGISYSINGIGFEKAIQICYLMNTSYLMPNHTFSDACRCSYFAARQLGYIDTLDEIENAWIAVGVEIPSNLAIIGSSTLCSEEQYYVENLPSGYDVVWQLSDNNHFSINATSNYVSVLASNYNNQRATTLTALISYNGRVIKTLSKDIYTHGTALSISGTQEAYSSSLGYYPEQTFSYNVTNAGSGFSSSNIIINADCDIVLESERFQGMEISFEGNGAPTNVQHNGSFISFHTRPYSINYAQIRSISGGDDLKPLKPAFYPFTMQLRDEEGCSDFDLNFKVETLPFLNDSELQISTTSTTLYAHLLTAYATPIGGGLYQQPTWYLSVINSQTGQIMTSKTVTGSDTTVNISSYSSGMYIVRAMHDGNTYSAKFIK